MILKSASRTQKRVLAVVWLLAAVFLIASGSSTAAGEKPQESGGVRAGEPRFRVIRSVSGTEGTEENGQFVIKDPRTIIYLPQDHQVMVYFEWEGPAGKHNFEGIWKNPEGKVVTISDFSYEATQKRFGGYWRLLLDEKCDSGIWMIEARIDGEVAGTHSFQIIASERPPLAPSSRRRPSASEIYQEANAATVFIEKLNPSSERVAVGSGFFIEKGLVLTTFQVIDGASLLRIAGADGRISTSEKVVAWNRWQDWAVIRVETDSAGILSRAQADSWKVGDRCFSLDARDDSSRMIVDANIIGKQQDSRAGERVTVSFSLYPRAIGSPLLNEYGEVIGIVGAGIVPGATSLEVLRTGFPVNLATLEFTYRRDQALPISLVPATFPVGKSTTLGELASSGQFVPLLSGYRDVASGTLAASVRREGSSLQAVDDKFEFSRRVGHMAVLLTWDPKEKRKGRASVRLYNLDNKLLFESKFLKVTLHPGEVFFSMWEMTLGENTSPGIYRLDVVLDSDTVWRTFLKWSSSTRRTRCYQGTFAADIRPSEKDRTHPRAVAETSLLPGAAHRSGRRIRLAARGEDDTRWADEKFLLSADYRRLTQIGLPKLQGASCQYPSLRDVQPDPTSYTRPLAPFRIPV